MILQQLSQIQSRFGFLPREELVALAERLAVPLFRIEEVVSFYPHFHKETPPQVEIHVCRDMACCLRGSLRLIDDIKSDLAAEIAAGKAAVQPVSCLGRCDRAPAARVHHHPAGSKPAPGELHEDAEPCNQFGRSSQEVTAVARCLLGGEPPPFPSDLDADLPDQSESWRINLYAGKPREERYAALRRTVQAMRLSPASGDAERDRIIQSALKNAVLLGMGGAGGQAFKKWCEVREAVGEQKYVVCNADESEPGTFKDRELLLRTPYLVLEGILLASVVLGAEQAYLYIRHEYEECITALRDEIAWLYEQGLCGERILGSDLTVDLELFISPGGYICGEQTALIQAIQDQRAEPRNRPPELQTNGLWDMPTLVNNVETLAWAPAIVLLSASGYDLSVSGGHKAPGDVLSPSSQLTQHVTCRALERSSPQLDQSWYASQGRAFGELAALILSNDKDWQRRHGMAPRFPGLRFFSVSGDVAKPGVYEVENGITLRELIDRCGGMVGHQKLKAIALSGPSGGFTPAILPRAAWPRKIQQRLPIALEQIELLDLQMHINYFRLWDLMLGAGLVVYSEEADLVAQALACLKFFQAESCGKCVPCRIGSTKLAEIGEILATGRLPRNELDALAADSGLLNDLAFTMASTAICGLGTVAPNPLITLLKYFPGDVEFRLGKFT